VLNIDAVNELTSPHVKRPYPYLADGASIFHAPAWTSLLQPFTPFSVPSPRQIDGASPN
jgi:hypothetical protein